MYHTKHVASLVTLLALTLSFAGIGSAQEEEDLSERVDQLEKEQQSLLEQVEQLEEENRKLRQQKAGDAEEAGENQEGEDDFSITFGGRLMIDYVFSSVDEDVSDDVESFHSDSTATDSGAEFRRARLYSAGEYLGVGYKLQLDFAGGTSIKDAYLDFPSPLPTGYSVKVGRFYEPWGLEGQTSSKYLTFMEFALPVDTFYAFRTNGIGAWGATENERIHWGASFTRSDTDGFGDSRVEGNYAGSARLTGLPYVNDDEHQLLHVGIGGSTRSVSDLNFAARPESHIVDSFLDTGDSTGGSPGDTFDAERTTVGNLEAALVWDAFSFQAEYFRNEISDSAAGINDPVFDGYYLYTTYWLTGEHRNFDKKSALFGRPEPKRPFLKGDGPGAWELAARYSSLNLDDGGVQGGEMNSVTLGVNWWMNRHVKLMFNYVTAVTDDGVDGADGRADFVGTRFQVDF